MTGELQDEHWLVVHELRLRGIAELPDGPALEHVVATGYALRKRTRVALTPTGREAHADWARLDPGSAEAEVAERAYTGFLPLNGDLIRVCSDWQVRPGGVANDHRDMKYDWEVIDRLIRIDERVGPILRRLGDAVPRFAGYRARLRDALRKLEDGGHDWFTSPRIDSYHTVWMCFHEDLLLALGRSRADEPELT